MPLPYCIILFLNDLKDTHRTGLGADAAGNALGGGALGGLNHNLHRADLNTFAAGCTQLLIDHIHAGLRILRNGARLTDLHAFTALNTGHRLSTAALSNHLNGTQVRVKGLIKGGGAGTNALQARHTLGCFIYH